MGSSLVVRGGGVGMGESPDEKCGCKVYDYLGIY